MLQPGERSQDHGEEKCILMYLGIRQPQRLNWKNMRNYCQLRLVWIEVLGCLALLERMSLEEMGRQGRVE